MSHYYLFLPHMKEPDPQELEARGVASLFDGPVATSYAASGMNGQPGLWCVVHPPTEPPAGPPNVLAGQQKWATNPSPGCGDVRYWVGYEAGSPPKPSDFRRENDFESTPVRLLDGELWSFPLIPRLPASVCGETLLMLAQEIGGMVVFEDYQPEVLGHRHYTGSVTLCVQALCLNYRVPVEMLQSDLLALINLERRQPALLAVLTIGDGIEQYSQWRFKNMTDFNPN